MGIVSGTASRLRTCRRVSGIGSGSWPAPSPTPGSSAQAEAVAGSGACALSALPLAAVTGRGPPDAGSAAPSVAGSASCSGGRSLPCVSGLLPSSCCDGTGAANAAPHSWDSSMLCDCNTSEHRSDGAAGIRCCSLSRRAGTTSALSGRRPSLAGPLMARSGEERSAGGACFGWSSPSSCARWAEACAPPFSCWGASSWLRSHSLPCVCSPVSRRSAASDATKSYSSQPVAARALRIRSAALTHCEPHSGAALSTARASSALITSWRTSGEDGTLSSSLPAVASSMRAPPSAREARDAPAVAACEACSPPLTEPSTSAPP
mmetsp:Transcript_14526/g.60616  ORF Transcript_14526/g.60616 Transcript_14526/m.60616 type:complete len:320 (+) Transcript_14526:1140-2099(+)